MRLDQLKMSEIAEVERLSKTAFSAISDPKTPKGTIYQAIAYVIKRREDPSYKYEQAGELTFDEINKLLLEGENDSDPL